MRSFVLYAGCCVMVAALAIPRHSASAPVPPATAAPLGVDTVWYFTNRSQSDGAWTRQRGPLAYGVRTCDVDVPFFEHLTQGFECASLELGKLVEEQHAAVCE